MLLLAFHQTWICRLRGANQTWEHILLSLGGKLKQHPAVSMVCHVHVVLNFDNFGVDDPPLLHLKQGSQHDDWTTINWTKLEESTRNWQFLRSDIINLAQRGTVWRPWQLTKKLWPQYNLGSFLSWLLHHLSWLIVSTERDDSSHGLLLILLPAGHHVNKLLWLSNDTYEKQQCTSFSFLCYVSYWQEIPIELF
jgi:hypothetical protein